MGGVCGERPKIRQAQIRNKNARSSRHLVLDPRFVTWVRNQCVHVSQKLGLASIFNATLLRAYLRERARVDLFAFCVAIGRHEEGLPGLMGILCEGPGRGIRAECSAGFRKRELDHFSSRNRGRIPPKWTPPQAHPTPGQAEDSADRDRAVRWVHTLRRRVVEAAIAVQGRKLIVRSFFR